MRISLAGGGTDLPDFYHDYGGAVVSTTINRYLHVILNRRLDNRIYVGCSNREVVDHVDELKHELVREAMKKTGVTEGIEIAVMGDVPSTGSGLGSSSSLTVGLLNALHTFAGRQVSMAQLAEEACSIEIGVLKKPIGVQDQYIAAYGGLRFFDFQTGGIRSEPIEMEKRARQVLNDELLLFHTGIGRKAETILTEQRANIPDRRDHLLQIRKHAYRMRTVLQLGGNGVGTKVAKLLQTGWETKQELAGGISSPEIERMITTAYLAGAWGGKLCGSGGGGHLLLYVRREQQTGVRRAMSGLGLTELEFDFEPYGSRVIFNG